MKISKKNLIILIFSKISGEDIRIFSNPADRGVASSQIVRSDWLTSCQLACWCQHGTTACKNCREQANAACCCYLHTSTLWSTLVYLQIAKMWKIPTYHPQIINISPILAVRCTVKIR